jgi:hypothetical protein
MIFSMLVILLVVLLVLVILLGRFVMTRVPSEQIRFDWVVDTSSPHYRNIMSVLDPNASFRQRIDRRREMREYLRSHREDFKKLTYMIKKLIVMSPYDRPDLSTILARHSVLFNVLMLLVEWRLAVYVLGGRAHHARFFVNMTVTVVVSVRELASALTAQFLIEGA